MFTAHFGKIKGEAERDLLALSKITPSLKPYSVRPGMVDSINHPEVIEALASRNGIGHKVLFAVVGPPVRTFWSSHVSPTRELGKFLVDLALSDGSVLKGEDIEDGRIIPNKVVRRMASEKFFGE
jgi:hypothetical protein